MNSSAPLDLQHKSPFIIKNGSDIFTYLNQLADDYQLQNIRFFNSKEQNDNFASFIPFDSIYPDQKINNHETNLSYFATLQELKFSISPCNWALIDCNDFKYVNLCDFIFKIFQALQNDFDITIPSCQPNGNLCLIGFGEKMAPSTPTNNELCNSTMAINSLERMVRIVMLCSGQKFDLTPREMECIDWVGKGKTSGEIGTILSISESTVEKHVTAVCQKLGAVNRMQMVAKAVRFGLI